MSELELTIEQKLIKALVRAVCAADQMHDTVGGGTRHWVRDCFLPIAREQGLKIVLIENINEGNGDNEY